MSDLTDSGTLRTGLIGLDVEPRTAAAMLACDNASIYYASGEGRLTFQFPAPPPTGGAWLHVDAPGYVTTTRRCLLPVFDGTQPVYTLLDEQGAPITAVTLTPVVVQLPAIHVEGRDFVDANGRRHVICGSTELMLAWRYDNAGPDAIRPILEERQAIGFNNLRVLWQKDIGNTGHSLWLMPVEKLRPFLSLAAAYGFYIQGCILADCQGQQDEPAQQARVVAVREATAGITNNIEQLGNEFSKNGFEPQHFARPTDRLAANASNVEGGAYAPFWDFMCFSGQRSPLSHAIREYGAIEFMYGDVVRGVNIPAICDEGFKPGINSSDPRDLERAGAQGRSGCGGRLHSWAGTTGASCLFSDIERDYAAAFVRGLMG